MANPDQMCDTCREGIEKQFDPDTGTRDVEIIAGDLFVEGCCFVRDEIRFLNNGRLIFVPAMDPEMKEGKYCEEYVVICRKLVVVGGNKPGNFNPCGPDDPGQTYNANNVITWQHRLVSAPAGPNWNPFSAADGASHDKNDWSSNSNGNNGAHGGDGDPGNPGKDGAQGRDAPSFTLVAAEVEIGVGDHLTIDFDGQNGGDGGRGQNGGDGGTGMGGRDGKSDTSWPGTGCDRQPGNGGNGGDGGDGGQGGNGGAGGDAGRIVIYGSEHDVTAGAFVSGNISYINDGGSGGGGGLGGIGGRGGQNGTKGFPTSECNKAADGVPGTDGSPTGIANGPGSNQNTGNTGSHGGSGGSPSFNKLEEGSCLELLPLPIVVSSIVPDKLCRDFASPGSQDVAIHGSNLSQVVDVAIGLTGVTTTIKPSSTDAQLDLKVDIAGNSALGTANVTLTPGFGNALTQNNAVTVQRFEVLSVAPASGARGNSVAVTITGQCFDTSAAIQQVTVSGAAVNVLNVAVIDSQTVTCVIEIGAAAPANARNVTVKTGTMQHTLVGGFTVTP